MLQYIAFDGGWHWDKSKNMFFWHDCWFLEIFVIARNKDAKVVNYMDMSNGCTH